MVPKFKSPRPATGKSRAWPELPVITSDQLKAMSNEDRRSRWAPYRRTGVVIG